VSGGHLAIGCTRDYAVKNSVAKGGFLIAAGTAIFAVLLTCLLHCMPALTNVPSLATTLIGFGVAGWLWIAVNSVSLALTFGLLIKWVGKDALSVGRYRSASILASIATLASSILLADLIQWEGSHMHPEDRPRAFNADYCEAIEMVGATVSLMGCGVCLALSLFRAESPGQDPPSAPAGPIDPGDAGQSA
jgi:hypothetical protein